jgi:tetratricopeptide (TPR) repeat protein
VPSRIETEVRRIAALMGRGEYESALAAAQALCIEVPENRDVLYMLAVTQRRLKRIPDALQTLALLEKHYPTFSRQFQERGHCLVDMRAATPAVEAYQRAVALNSCLVESWNALHALFRMMGRTAEAQDAATQAAQLAALPAGILSAYALFADGDRVVAEELVRDHIRTHGEHVEGIRLLAKIAADAGAEYDAQLLLQRALDLAPQNEVARYEYAVILLKRQRHDQAREQTERLLALSPASHSYRTLHAAAAAGLGDYKIAVPLYRDLSVETPEQPELHVSLGNALKTLGRTQDAIDAYRAAAQVRPGFGEAYWSLANLKTYRFTDQEIARMRQEEASTDVTLTDRCHLCFALGKALEDRSRYAESFEYYQRGNSLKKTEFRYRPELLERVARLQATLCTRDFFESRKNFGSPDRSPIFIVGLPRSGSTLIEQILACHSKVDGTMELPDIPRLALELQGSELAAATPGYPRVLAELSAQTCARFAERYLRDTRVYRTERPHFIDKMPNNFRHLDLIHLILPNARIIDARREPMACCFSVFKQLFAAGQRFAYSIEDIARYYAMYVELMAHWDDALPRKILRVQHEELVNDFEPNVRRILDFCGLEFEPACLEFYKAHRSVHSASSEQVRQPVYREGIDHWRHFEPWLGPMRQALAPLMDNDA